MLEGQIFCPLCGNVMRLGDKYYTCAANNLHSMLIDKEWQRYKSGEKDMAWLRFRMKVRMGKKVHQG